MSHIQTDAFEVPREKKEYKLRDYQEKAISMYKQSIIDGKKRAVLALGTGGGKTHITATLMKGCQDKGKRGGFLMDRIQLVEQTINVFKDYGIDFGVRQSNHELMNPKAPIQIISIQSLQTAVVKHKKPLPEFDFLVHDEAHISWDIVDLIMNTYDNIPVLALTATPFSKGMGKRYNNLLVPITTREMEERGYLCPVRYFGGEHVNLSKVRSSDRNSYRQDDLARETDKDADRLVGCVIRNWLELGENAQTIAFSPTQNLSKMLVQRFNDNGISAEHVDCYSDKKERDDLFKAHDAGEFKILSCSRLLNTGYDAPSVGCIIDCFPVKSITTWVQRVGRGKRIFPGKEYCIYLDHADNFSRFGYQEDIVPESLDMGEKTHDEKELVKKEKKEPKKRECPQCTQLMVGMKCQACGFEVPIQEAFEDDGSDLQEITGDPKKANRVDSKEIKSQFLSELNFYAESKGYKLGWAANQYLQRYGCWPNRINSYQVAGISQMTKNWITHQQIKYRAQQRKKKG